MSSSIAHAQPAKPPAKAPAGKGGKGGKTPAPTPPPTTTADTATTTTAPVAEPPKAEPTPPAATEPVAPPAEAPAPPAEDKPAGWVFDGDIGLPRLKSNESSLAFDVSTGYLGRHWGFGVYASMYNYALQTDTRLSNTQRVRYGLDLRYLSGTAADDVRYEGKAEINSGAFSTSTINTGANALSGDGTGIELSTISRITLLLGRRARVSDAFLYKFALGAGSQFDSYSRSGTAGAELSLQTSVRFLGRAQARYAVLPETLVMRAEAEAATFQIRRLPSFGGGTDTAQAGAEPPKVIDFRETDVRLRLFGDLKMLSFAGLMPGAFVGLDYVAVSGDGGSTSALIPIFGVGLVNATAKD